MKNENQQSHEIFPHECVVACSSSPNYMTTIDATAGHAHGWHSLKTLPSFILLKKKKQVWQM